MLAVFTPTQSKNSTLEMQPLGPHFELQELWAFEICYMVPCKISTREARLYAAGTEYRIYRQLRSVPGSLFQKAALMPLCRQKKKISKTIWEP
jgi:hypothetical protein